MRRLAKSKGKGSSPFYSTNILAARWSVHRSDKAGVEGSSPSGGTNGFEDKRYSCLIVNQDAVGSSPIRAAKALIV